MSRRSRQRWIVFSVLLTTSAIAGPAFVAVAHPHNKGALAQAAVDGLIGGALLWGGVLFLWPSPKLASVRRRAFPFRVLLLCAFTIFVVAMTATFSVYRVTGKLTTAWFSWSLCTYIIAVTLAVLVVLQVVRMIGSRAIANVQWRRHSGVAIPPRTDPFRQWHHCRLRR